MRDALQLLLDRCPEADAVAIMDPTGIPVMVEPREADVEVLGAEMASMVQEMENASLELNHGTLRQLEVMTDVQSLVLSRITAGYFLLLFMQPDGISGRARFFSRVVCSSLYSEFE